MCVTSMVGDHYADKWRHVPIQPIYPDQQFHFYPSPQPITRAEFDQLKAEVAECVALLKKAKKYDEERGEPECETDAKMRVIREVARLVGVDLDAELTQAEASTP